MTIKELIEKLKKWDENATVLLYYTDSEGYVWTENAGEIVAFDIDAIVIIVE